jgi:hypothetical protein
VNIVHVPPGLSSAVWVMDPPDATAATDPLATQTYALPLRVFYRTRYVPRPRGTPWQAQLWRVDDAKREAADRLCSELGLPREVPLRTHVEPEYVYPRHIRHRLPWVPRRRILVGWHVAVTTCGARHGDTWYAVNG